MPQQGNMYQQQPQMPQQGHMPHQGHMPLANMQQNQAMNQGLQQVSQNDHCDPDDETCCKTPSFVNPRCKPWKKDVKNIAQALEVVGAHVDSSVTRL